MNTNLMCSKIMLYYSRYVKIKSNINKFFYYGFDLY